ncbi:histone acetyltransferase KAT6B-like, partial [Stegastes partitus]|uniref:Histone acetyltransferase KAT6B-like n=1 Tax=Stegastes partitus TaxID=144197 RepID=A0A9Y4NVV4_9TELE
MELSCESVRCAEDRRPASCKFVELHVLYVPADQWNVKLNKVPAEAIDSFISAGFIRVYPDTTLRTLRRELGALLGADGSIDRFSFLKCVGRSLALVKSKQERDLKVKTFAPPYAAQPELYLLPTVEADSSVCSQSLSPDTSSSSPEQHVYYQPPKMCSLPAGTKEPVKFPHIPQRSQQSPPTPRPDEEEEDEEEEEEEEEEEDDDDEQSYSTSEDEEEALSSMRRAENRRAPQPLPLNKASQRHEADSARPQDLPEKEETFTKRRQYQRGSRAAGRSGAAESLEDSGDSGFSLTDGAGKSKDVNMMKSVRNKPTAEVVFWCKW